MEGRENPCVLCKPEVRNKMNCGWSEVDEMTPLPNPCQNRIDHLKYLKEKCDKCKSIPFHYCVGQCTEQPLGTCEDRRS